MRKVLLAALAAALLSGTVAARADDGPTFHGAQNAAETTFVKNIQADLMKRFPTAADAEKAGYVRYTEPDDTGAISYANLHWVSQDAAHPSQLWYDKAGNLLGADFSVLQVSKVRPKLWGIDPGRWAQFDGHIHWVTKDPATGKMTYDLWMPNPKFVAAGGSVTHPDAATLVKLGKVKSADDVSTVFEFPAVWDLIVWVKPNPSGAFADKNPDVTP